MASFETLQKKITVRIGKTNRDIEIDLSRFNDEVLLYVIHYGLKQRLNDVHASMSLDDDGADEINAQVDKALNALYSGDIRVAGERTSDPVRRMALQNATNAILLQYKKQKKTPDAKAVRNSAKHLVDTQPQWLASAAVQYAAISEAADDLDIELPEAAE